MYENLDIHEYVKRMQEWDDRENLKAQKAIEAAWEPVGEPYVWESGLTGQLYQMKKEVLDKIRGDV